MTAGLLAPPVPSYSHSHSSSLLASECDISYILEPSYRPRSRSGASSAEEHPSASCSSLKHSTTSTFGSAHSDASAHDPEFRPFMTPVSANTRPRITHFGSSAFGDDARHSAPPSPGRLRARARTTGTAPDNSSFFTVSDTDTLPHTPARRSFDILPLEIGSPPPSKEERDAARRQLAPSLQAALRANERRAAVRAQQQEKQRSWLRRAGRLGRRSSPLPMTAVEESPAATMSAARHTTYPAIRTLSSTSERVEAAPGMVASALVSDDSVPPTPADSETHADESEGESDKPVDDDPCHGFRKRVASITLKVDLALFRAKKRVKSRVGMD